MTKPVRGVIGVKIGGITLTSTSYRIDETSHILGLPETKIREELESGRLQAACPNGVKKKPICITTESIVDYYNIIVVPKEKWSE